MPVSGSVGNGSRWGTFKWGTGAWSDYQWYDLTSDLTGVQWSRGALPTGQGFPTASPGVMNFQLQDSGNTTYQPWSTVGGNLNREMKPGAIVRLVAFRPGAAGSVYYPGNGFSTMCRAGWKALYTGEVDEWKYTIVNGSALADVTCYETITQLAAIQKPAVAAEGANDDLITRIYRLTQDAGWAFHIVDTGQYRLQGDYFTNNYSTYYNERPDYILQATTMAAKRSAEIYLSAASILNTQVSNSGDGAILNRLCVGVYRILAPCLYLGYLL